MKRVTGIGGLFFKCDDPGSQQAWYRDRLGLDIQPWGGTAFTWRDDATPNSRGYTVWSTFDRDSDKFAPSDKAFMLNYWVADLTNLLPALRAEGVEVVGDLEQHDNGKFAWILDPEGNKIELWEPVPSDQDPYI